jgi:hypothetical protein
MSSKISYFDGNDLFFTAKNHPDSYSEPRITVQRFIAPASHSSTQNTYEHKTTFAGSGRLTTHSHHKT